MGARNEVPEEVVAGLAAICLALPEVVQVAAWTGVAWRVRSKTFAHVVVIDEGWPPVYARTFGTDGPATVLTFRSSGEELEVLGALGPPWFRPTWAPETVGLVLDGHHDADELAELLTESYCRQAPQKLVDLVAREG